MSEGNETQRWNESRRPYSVDGEDRSTSFLRTFRILRRRWFVLTVTCAVVVVLAGVLSFSSPASYRSEATIEVGPDRPRVPLDPIGESSSRSSHLWENHFRTQETLMRRPGLLAGVLESLTPDMVAKYRRSAEPVAALSEDVQIDAVPSTFLIVVSIDHDRPDNGPAIVNKLVALFIEDSNRRLLDLKSGALRALNTESLPVIRQKVAEAERALQSFNEELGQEASAGRYEALLDAAKKIGERRLDVRIRAIGLKSSPSPRADDLAGGALSPGADPGRADPHASTLATLETERTTTELELARQKVLLKDRHPSIQALQSRLDAIAALIKAASEAEVVRRDRAVDRAMQKRDRELAASILEERALDEEEASLNARIAKAHELVGRRKELESEVASSRELLNSYLKSHGQFEAVSGAGLASVRIVDPAREAKRLVPRHGFHLTLGLIAGLVLGALAVLVADQVDDRIMNPQRGEAVLGLDLLATIPTLPETPGNLNLPRVPSDEGPSESLEPFRRLRTEIAARLEGKPGPRILAVLSAKYGEGKSTVAINLARAFALEGRRVLLVDADLRRPGLKSFLANRHAPGLEEYLENGIALPRCAHPSRMPGVHLLAPQAPIEGAAEVAGRDRFRAMWPALKSMYDLVVVDTSPVEAASEAAVIAAVADSSLLVVDERGTHARDAARARRRLESHHVRVMGLVVNRSQSGLVPPFDSTRSFLSIDRISGERNAFLEVG